MDDMAETKSPTARFTAEERAAMKQRNAELKMSQTREAGMKQLADAIAGMTGLDKQLAQQVHEVVTAAGPGLGQKTYYGFPAYTVNDKTILFFKPAAKFKERYATLAFDSPAKIDDGTMWATSWAVTAPLTDAQKKMLSDLVKKAASAA
jgi:uncharacterized protein YdhG (YjbR/CyaY superfamily)